MLFQAKGKGMELFVTERGLSYFFLKSSSSAANGSSVKEAPVEYCRIDMFLEGSSIKRSNIVASGSMSFLQHYYTNAATEGIRDVHSYEKIVLRDIYPGIDWALYTSGENGFKYDFIVHPGADPSLIKMVYGSLLPLQLNKENNILIETAFGTLSEKAPYSYAMESKKMIPSKFMKRRLDAYRTEITVPFDPSVIRSLNNSGQTLVIDPQLVWATFYGGGGGSSGEIGEDICTDAAGNVFVTGFTSSLLFPLQNPGGGAYYQSSYGGSIMDAFVLKFSPSCGLLWSTYYGGSNYERGNGICTDAAGNVYVTGWTASSNFPFFNPGGGAFCDSTYNGGDDIFVLRFTNAGLRTWATYYGGASSESGWEITVDNAGGILITGGALSGFPTLNPGGGAFVQAAYGGGTYDAFILKFSASLAPFWATYYGSSGNEVSHGVAVDATGNIFITGGTNSTLFPLLNPGGGSYFQGSFGGNFDAFIVKFSSTGVRQWATFYGGSNFEWSEGIAIKPSGQVYITGATGSPNFPLQNPGGGAYYQSTFGGGVYDVYIVRFSNAGIRQWATYYGGNNYDESLEIATDASGTLYLSGATNSTNFPVQSAGACSFFDNTYAGGTGSDVFISVFNNSETLTWASYYGATDNESGFSIAPDASGNFYVTGYTFSTNFPLLNPGGGAYFQNTLAGGSGTDNVILLKFCPNCAPTVNATATANSCFGANNGTASASMAGGTGPYTYSWSNSTAAATATGLSAGIYTIVITDANGCSSTASAAITQPALLTATATATAASCGQNNGSASITASGGTGAYTYSWSNGNTQSATSNLSAGIYTVTVTDNNGCSKTTTASVTSTGAGTATATATAAISCNGSSNGSAMSSISGGTSPYTYSWNNGQLTQGATGLSAGTYTITITDTNGCIATQTLNISQPSAVTATATATAASCGQNNGSASATANGGTGSYTYSWSTGATTSSIINQPSNIYTVTITDANACTQTASVNVGTTGGPIATATAAATNISSGTSTTLTGTGGGSYTWSPSAGLSCTNCANPTASPTITTQYCLTVTDTNGCTDLACVTLYVESPCPGSDNFSVPNAFSPNGDGRNDLFELHGWKDCINTFVLTVFDRWGEKVFESEDPGKSWEGTRNGKELDAAVYVYYISATNTQGEPFIRKGNITLMR